MAWQIAQSAAPTRRRLAAFLVAGLAAGSCALRAGDTASRAAQAVDRGRLRSSRRLFGDGLWGEYLPQITSSPGEDLQRCPDLKLPDNIVAMPTSRSWFSLNGKWVTNNGGLLATWEQNFLSMVFSSSVEQMGVTVRSGATAQVAVRMKVLTNEQMDFRYQWKAPNLVGDAAPPAAKLLAPTLGRDITSAPTRDLNVAIFDCMGNLMYVVREERATPPSAVRLYSRDQKLIARAFAPDGVLRYQWVGPDDEYLIATAEAPGINANISRQDIPRYAEVGNVLPFGFRFERGGYAGSSALMNVEYRWVIAAAVQGLAIHNAEVEFWPWSAIIAAECVVVLGVLAAFLAVVGLAFCVYRTVFPHERTLEKQRYGSITDNPFLAVPPRPPLRGESEETAQSRSSRS